MKTKSSEFSTGVVPFYDWESLFSIQSQDTSPLSSAACFSIDHPVIGSLWSLLLSYFLMLLIITSCLSFIRNQLNVPSSGRRAYSLSSTSFIPRPISIRTPQPFASLFLFSIHSWPHPSFSIFPVNGLISFYPGAQQINRYCIMAKTGKAPLCP